MDILIEGSKLDFKLETEENLFEVVECLESWLSKKSQLIDEIKVDGNDFALSKDKLKDKLITKTDKIEIKTVNHDDYAASSLVTVERYINRFLLEIENDNFLTPSNKDEIIDGLKWINDVIMNSARVLLVKIELLFYYEKSLSELVSKNNILIVELENYKYNPSIFKEIISIKVKNNLKNILHYLPRIIDRSILQFSAKEGGSEYTKSIISNMKDMINTIESFMPALPNIGYILHSGKEAQAYLEIKSILFVMESMVFCLKRVELIYKIDYALLKALDDKTVDIVNKEFNSLLEELSASLLSKDVVLLCDLLEYEVIEKLKIYKIIFEDLIVLIGKKDYS